MNEAVQNFGRKMISCKDCKKKDECTLCGEQICEVHRAELKVCKIVGFYDENGKFVCEKCHTKHV